MKKLILCTLMGLLTQGLSAQMKTFLDVPYIEVFGSADTLVTPNEIYISIVIAEAEQTSIQAVQPVFSLRPWAQIFCL